MLACVGQAEGGAVDPGQIGSLGRRPGQLGDGAVQLVGEVLLVLVDPGDGLGQPVAAVGQRRRVRHHTQVASRLRHIAAQAPHQADCLRARDDQASLQAREVPRLRRRRHGQRPLTARHQLDGGVLRTRERGVDLVADDGDAVGVRQFHHPRQLVSGVHDPRRVVRRAQQVGGGMLPLEGLGQRIEV